MNKVIKKTIIGIMIVFFFTISPYYLVAQNKQSSQVTSPGIGGEPIILEDETLFLIYAQQGGLSLQERAQRINQRLKDFAQDPSLSLNALEIYSSDQDGLPLTTLSVGNILLMLISDIDAQKANKSRPELAQEYLTKIKDTVARYRQERNISYFLKALIWSGIATATFVILIFIINNIFNNLYHKIKIWGESYINPVRFGNWEIIRTNQLDDVIAWLLHFFQSVIIIGLLTIYFPLILHQFPWTRGWAKIFEGYLLETLQVSTKAFIGYLPNLLTIIFIIFITLGTLRFAKSFFRELGEGKLSIPGFYTEWANATYKLVSFLIIALASVVIFPLLPGFQSPAFQGISVFLGLLISLGSTSVIANLISGSVLIYTRAFRVGDHIKINDVTGRVLETSLLVTRILTSTNAVISIPNSQISTSSIENFSFGYREFKEPLILRVTIYLGYEVLWRDAYKVLMESALKTTGILHNPEPFVLQGELNEVFVTYLLNAYIDMDYFKDKTLKEVEKAHSELNENIRDCCASYGIYIFAPNYEADPTNYGPTSNRS